MAVWEGGGAVASGEGDAIGRGVAVAGGLLGSTVAVSVDIGVALGRGVAAGSAAAIGDVAGVDDSGAQAQVSSSAATHRAVCLTIMLTLHTQESARIAPRSLCLSEWMVTCPV
jgi:hypothetical protein